MANITMLHWNIQKYGEKKFDGKNSKALGEYVARVIYITGAAIVSLIEVNNKIAEKLAANLAATICQWEKIPKKKNPWRLTYINSNVIGEAYFIMYRLDRNFVPLDEDGDPGATYAPASGLTDKDEKGNKLKFPKTHSKTGGRKPYFATFMTTDTDQPFSVIAFHNQFNTYSGFGVESVAKIGPIKKLVTTAGHPNITINSNLISGDFNVDFVAGESPSWYEDLEAISYYAVDEETSLKGVGAKDSDNPEDYRSMAYDNIFQRVTKKSNAHGGAVVDLLVQSAKIEDNDYVPDGTYQLFSYAGAFKADIYDRKVTDGSIAWVIPPLTIDNSFDLYRELISDHLPVLVTTTI